MKGPDFFNWGKIAFSPDGKLVAACQNQDGNLVACWEVATGRCCWKTEEDIVRDESSKHYGFAICFAPDSKTLAVGSWDRTVRLYPLGR